MRPSDGNRRCAVTSPGHGDTGAGLAYRAYGSTQAIKTGEGGMNTRRFRWYRQYKLVDHAGFGQLLEHIRLEVVHIPSQLR